MNSTDSVIIENMNSTHSVIIKYMNSTHSVIVDNMNSTHSVIVEKYELYTLCHWFRLLWGELVKQTQENMDSYTGCRYITERTSYFLEMKSFAKMVFLMKT